jgi:hypothetical protein
MAAANHIVNLSPVYVGPASAHPGRRARAGAKSVLLRVPVLARSTA